MLHAAHLHGKHPVIAFIHPVRVLRFRVLLGIVVPLVLNLLGIVVLTTDLRGHIVGDYLLLVSNLVDEKDESK